MEYITKKNIIKKSIIKKGFANFLNFAEEFGLNTNNKKYFKDNWSNKELHENLIKLKKKQYSQIYDNFQKSSFIYDLLNSNRLFSLAANFLNTDLDKLFLHNAYLRMDKPKDKKHILGWHNDDIYSKKGCTIWCPLTNVSPLNGTIQIVPGSTKEFDQKQKNKSKNINLTQGDLLIFNVKMFHRSGYNKSSKIRFVLIYHFYEI
jgi:ectoine hydroxylase-related dioxygenase (phytanoyl-CoA dioxygenase family)